MSYEDVLIRESVGDGSIDPDDVCMVCEKRDCVCPPDSDFDSLDIRSESPNESTETDWPSIEEQQKYWETHDHGGNVIPSRIEANIERYDLRVCRCDLTEGDNEQCPLH